MSFPNAPGVYGVIEDRSYVVSGSGLLVGAIVVTSTKGPIEPNIVTSITQLIDQYGEPSTTHPSLYCAERFLRRAGILNVVRVVTDAETAAGALVDSLEATHLEITAANPGSWGNDITVTFATLPNEATGTFRVIVSLDGEQVETHDVSRTATAKNGYGTNIYIENVINNQSKYIRVTDVVAVTEAYDLSQTITLTGGTDDAAAPSDAIIIAGFDNFVNENSQPANILINAGWATTAVATKMTAVSDGRRNCRAILDVPYDDRDSVADIIVYRETTLGTSTYLGGLYGGWLKIIDQYNGVPVEIAPSGDVAANFVQTVTRGEYWDAPAGNPNGVIPGAVGVSKIFSEAEIALLYTAGVNPITAYDGNNAVIMGQKTLQKAASALDRWNVVNNVLNIRVRVLDALKPFVFKNNTAFSRQNVDFLLRSFLTNVQNRGGLYGFEVDVSEAINTAQVIDNNQMLVNVFLKPTRTAEFIKVGLIITPTGVDFA